MRFLLAMCLFTTCAALGGEPSGAEAQFTALRDEYVRQFEPLYVQREMADWDASIAGTDEAFARKEEVERQLIELHSRRDVFEKLKGLREGGSVRDPLLARQLDVMYRAHLPGQADPELQRRIVTLKNEVEQIFNTHRGTVDGKPLSENDLREILGTTRDSRQAEAAWKAYMEVGRKAEAALHELVGLRNELARSLGFANFYVMQLALQEIDEQQLLALFEELEHLTREPFAALKQEIDAKRAAHFGVGVADLRPWHFADLFFQEAPPLGEIDFDELYASADLLALARQYYAGLGLPADDILERSDLYEKPGKSPHAFCSDINRAGDVRVLCNLKPNLYWADTLLHELGHGVYDKFIDPDLPFLLRSASHGITTEGIALLFGSMSKTPVWLETMLQLDPARMQQVAPLARKFLRAEKLMFSRWALVMVHFERGMYGQPEQDLGKLWWDLKARYQLLNPPEDVQRPDFAAKAHVLTTPVYYHSYMMGELFAAQVKAKLVQELGQRDVQNVCFCNQPQAGRWLRERVFAPANRYTWNDLTRLITGEPLTARYFAAEYVE